MNDVQRRVVCEKTELDDKLKKLTNFMFNNSFSFSVLPHNEQTLMKEQHEIMGQYSKVLEVRISAFKKENV